MGEIRGTIFLVLVLLSFSISADGLLTRDSVGNMLAAAEAAVHEHDERKLLSYFTADGEITMVMPDSMGGAMVMDVEEYKALLRGGWSMPFDSTYEVRDIDITIAPDARSAIVTDLVIESVSSGGQMIMSSEARETMNIVMSGGVPKIQRLYATVVVKMNNNAAPPAI